jgi:hypothetical protein
MYCEGCAKSEGQALKAERENLALRAENASLKVRLAEAENRLEIVRHGIKCRQEAEARAHEVYHEAMDKLPVEAKYLHDPAAQPADMMARMVARAEAAERKCAELSEALRWMDRKGGLGLDVHERITAALASQPAPEGKP